MAADGDVLKALRTASKGLLFPSESDKPVKAFVWAGTKGAPNADAIKTAVKPAEGSDIKALSVEEFFAPVVKEQPWFGEEEKTRLTKFQGLVQALKDNLTDTQVFRVQEPDENTITAYVVGTAKTGELAGVQTQLVET